MNLVYHQDADAGTARWLVGAGSGPAPPALREAAGLRDEVVLPFPVWYDPFRAYTGTAPVLELPPPEATVLANDPTPSGRRIRVRLRSPRGAPVVVLAWPEESRVREIRMNGVLVPQPDGQVANVWNGWQVVRSTPLPPEGAEVELTVDGTTPLECLLLDESFDLLADGDALRAARPADAVPHHHGDQTVVSRRISL